ncbi:RNA polymerase sigma factor [Flavitalea flava]
MEKEFLKAIGDHQKIIYKICRIYRDRPEDREDLFQEIVYQLWKSFPSFKKEARLSSWMYRVGLNTAMAIYRKSAAPTDYYEEIPDNLVLPGEGAIEGTIEGPIPQMEERLFSAIRLLSDSEKAVISLYLEDFSYREIGEITGLSDNNVGVKLNRIKHKLKKIIN